MNYEDLISKYLDGELSKEEDNELRSFIANNPSIKKDFDDAIFVHCVLKSEAENLQVPEDLKQNTQDLVMMNIIKDQEEYIHTQTYRSKITNFTIAVAAVVIFGFSYISDYPMLRHLNELFIYQSIELKNSNKKDTSINISDISQNERINVSRKSKSNVKINNDIYSNKGLLAENNSIKNSTNQNSTSGEKNNSTINEFSILNENNINNNENLNYSIIDDISNDIKKENLNNNELQSSKSEILNTESEHQLYIALNYSKSNLIHNGNYSNNIKYNNKNDLINKIENEQEFNKFSSSNNIYSFTQNINSLYNTDPFVNLEFNSFYAGNSIYSNVNNIDSKLNIGFSQSIGFSINERHLAGIEVGNINYSYSKIEMLRVPSNFGNNNDDNRPSPTILMPITITNQTNYIWANLFYEYNLINFHNFKLRGRVGVGGNKAGFMNISRISASYRLLNSVNLSIGLDNRMFFIQDNRINGKEKLINSLSLIYGIQFSL